MKDYKNVQDLYRQDTQSEKEPGGLGCATFWIIFFWIWIYFIIGLLDWWFCGGAC
jgi:hypothetical protein